MFKANSTGIDPDATVQGKLLPKGWYTFEVVQFTSKAGDSYPLECKSSKGDPQVNVMLQVVDDPENNGNRVFHTVTFLPKEKNGKPTPGAGMWVHWLKTIDEPWEGEVEVMPGEWIGKKFKGYAIEDEYNGKKKNKLGEIKPLAATKLDTDDVQF